MAADPMSAGLEAGGGLLGGIFGLFNGAADREAARQAAQQAVANFRNIPLPALQQMIAQQLGPSAMQGVNADPALQGDQYGALGELGRIADSGGMTLEDRANYEDAQRQAAENTQRQRQSILNLMRRTGSGMQGGAAVASQLGAAGQEQEATALAGQRMSADAQRRATQAVLERAKTAGALRSQQFGEQAQKAAAADAVARYNTTARQTAQNYNLGIPEQQYNNQMQRATGENNALNNQRAQYTSDADRTQRTFANAGTGVGQMAAGFMPGAAAPSTGYDYPDVASPVNLDDENRR